jgi:F0F1-type ATP synthase epsilon subunit
MKHKGPDTPLKVIARAPFHVYYEGPAEVVSGANSVGKFDILPGHADFFSVMGPCEVAIEPTDPKAKPITFEIRGGIVGVRNDEVMLFVNM